MNKVILFLLTAQQAVEAAAEGGGLDLYKILVYYAIIELVLLPVYIGVVIILCKKKPEFIQRINNRIDQIVGIVPEARPAVEKKTTEKKEIKEEPAAVQEEKKEEKPEEKKTVEEINEELGVSNMKMRVGDTYTCYLGSEDIKHVSGRNFVWKSTNSFVAPIDERSGKVEAKKIGKTFIESVDKKIYYIEVVPTIKDWFLKDGIDIVLERASKDTISSRFISHKVFISNDDRFYTYEEFDNNIVSVQFACNKKFEALRVLYKFNNVKAVIDNIEKYVTEYFEPLKVNESKTSTKYWVHKTEDIYQNSVDFNAFLKVGKDGYLYFGLGECWRINASQKEMQDNPGMIERSFRDLLSEDEIPDKIETTAIIEEEPQPKKTPKKTSRKKKVTAPKNEEPAEEPKTEDESNNAEDGDNALADIDYTPENEENYNEETGENEDNEEDTPENDLNSVEIKDEYIEPFKDFVEGQDEE